MPTWLVGVLEWGVGLLLQHLDGPSAKKALASLLTAIDAAVQAAESRITGPFEGVADEVALAFHQAVVEIVAVLTK